MNERILTQKIITQFKIHLQNEEKNENTIQKYIRDVKALMEFTGGNEITKEAVISYKECLKENYKIRSVNSMLASVNALFCFLDRYDLKVKAIKLQQQIYCLEEKELTKAEYMRLCKTAKKQHNERLNLILRTICSTGIRISEFQFITVEAVRCGEATVSLKGKASLFSL